MDRSVRKRPPLLRALGRSEPPPAVEVAGDTYRLENLLKHDSWAATGIYSGPAGQRIICKFNRTQPIFIVPMKWLGRALARRESGFLRRLADIELVPNDLGPVAAGGTVLGNAVARVYVDGVVFTSANQTDARFFAEFRQLLDAVHERQMAYVDLHKRENLIVGRDGRPHLIDFQVSVGGSPRSGRVTRYVIAKLQEIDDYHYRKHFARCRPELLSPEERERYLEPPAWIRAHRKVAVPFRALRRRLLVALGVRDRSGHAYSEVEPEDAFRHQGSEKDAGSK